jgi:class 3 adenylate cyclase
VSEVLSVEQILALHPWPEAYAKDKRLEWLWHFDLPGDPEAIWRVISDTSRLNRALGVAQMVFESRGAERWGRAKNGGVAHEWLEVPWTWVAGQWLTCTRIYRRGFSKVMFAIHRVEPCDVGCRVYLYFGAIPRNALSRAALRIGFPGLGRAYGKILPAIAAQLDRLRPAVLELPAPELRPEAIQRLAAVRDKFLAERLDARCVDALLDWIAKGDEADLYRIQIRERARTWNLDERALLRVALHATRAGVLTLSWDTICPHCRGVTHENPALGTLRSDARCEVCDLDFTTASQDAVEVTFHVHPSIRAIAQRLFCSAEPATKDHIRAQLVVAPGAAVMMTPTLRPGRYRMRRHGERRYGYLDVHADSEASPAVATVVPWASAAGEVVRASPGVAIEILNPDPVERMFVLESSQWIDYALGPGQLLSLGDYRDLFSEDYVAADVHLAVGEQTLLFTDVVGSTAFYSERGDPGAFIEIKKHFDEVFAIVANHEGVAIKTIGDAVMAAFVSPVDAVRAARAIHDAFSPARTDSPIRLRISLNTGPCIAVRFNANIDYFGGTVNIAAKLQSLAESWQVAMSETTYQSVGVMDYLREQGATTVALSYTSKALPEPIGVRQWTVYR